MSKEFLSAKEAAEYIGFSEPALRSGRSRGVLAGVKPPAHIKRGKLVFFKKETLDKIIDQYYIEAILISKNEIGYYSNSDFILSTFYKKNKIINTPKYNLVLENQNKNVWLYSIKAKL